MPPLNKTSLNMQTILLLIIIGLAAGFLGGLVGIGGGIIIVPALVFFMAFSQHEAQGTSLALILLPVSILGVINYYKNGYVDLKAVGLLAIGFTAGSYFGSKYSLSLPQGAIKKIFAIFLLLVALKMLFLDKKTA
jgi:uncharacterized membrane protein YfcA